MRHGKKFNHLSRTAPHRKAMLSNMATSLILHKRIVTTVAKAKALRKYVEPLITRSKTDTTHSRRMVFRYLQDKESVKELFHNVSEKVMERPGGYTRILKTGNRLGDNADMCVIELVDYNESLLKESKPKKSRTRRSRRKSGSKTAAATTVATSQAAVETAEEAITDSTEAGAEEKEGAVATSAEEAAAETDATEETQVEASDEVTLAKSEEEETAAAPETQEAVDKEESQEQESEESKDEEE